MNSKLVYLKEPEVSIAMSTNICVVWRSLYLLLKLLLIWKSVLLTVIWRLMLATNRRFSKYHFISHHILKIAIFSLQEYFRHKWWTITCFLIPHSNHKYQIYLIIFNCWRPMLASWLGHWSYITSSPVSIPGWVTGREDWAINLCLFVSVDLNLWPAVHAAVSILTRT